MLQKTERFKDTEVVRSRDQEILKDLDIVIDVGGVYDPGEWRSDTTILDPDLAFEHVGYQCLSVVLVLQVKTTLQKSYAVYLAYRNSKIRPSSTRFY